MKIDLINCFPEPSESHITRGPLPKQREFIEKALSLSSPKYIRYVGGIGSGKTLVGCVTMLAWALQYPGDYLVARQFFPELRDTTMAEFFKICPEEVIIERRTADKLVKIRSNGGVATIMFRALEEPDKLRSLNLNAFHIDEANQVSEAAFELLQGRLRGRHVRKGILTQNSGGHDWSWRWFVEKAMHKTDSAKAAFHNIVAPTTENLHLASDYLTTMMDTWSDERIKRELMADEDSFEGAVYPEFKIPVHVIPGFAIPKDWQRVVGADHGYRNPAAWLWAAVDPEGDVYIYREFYKREWEVDEIALGKRDLESGERIPDAPGVVELSKGENPPEIYLDPSVRNRTGSKGGTLLSQCIESLPDTWVIQLANNAKASGIDRVKQYLKPNPRNQKPRLRVFKDCTNLINEFTSYRWQEHSPGRQGRENDKEEPIKLNDHAMDALRYLIMALPEPYLEELDWYEKHKVDPNSLTGHLHRDFEAASRPKAADPFSDPDA